MLYEVITGKDLRMYDTEELLDRAAASFLMNFNSFLKEYISKVFKSQKGYIWSEGVFNGFIYIFVVLKAYIGAISIGSIMKYAGAIQKLTEGLSDFFLSFALIRVDCRFLKNIVITSYSIHYTKLYDEESFSINKFIAKILTSPIDTGS